jgi:decaprenyl-phosphate phosphoribosyltransferase
MSTLIGLIRLARPKDWIKSVFVLLPVPFALASGEGELDPVRFALGLFGFCLVSSAVYCYNDAHDAEADRLHPRKKNRPVASGAVSLNAALMESIALLAAGSGLLYASGSLSALWLTLLYATANGFYTHYAKHIAPLDIFLLSSFFILRVFLGCALVDAIPSNWLLLCSSTLALFLVLAKRRADLAAGLDETHRQSLSGYSLAFLEQAMSITGGIAFLSYALYSMEADIFVPGREFYCLPFAAAGLLEYLRLALVRNVGGSPVDAATSEPSVLLCSVGWIIALALSLQMP